MRPISLFRTIYPYPNRPLTWLPVQSSQEHTFWSSRQTPKAGKQLPPLPSLPGAAFPAQSIHLLGFNVVPQERPLKSKGCFKGFWITRSLRAIDPIRFSRTWLWGPLVAPKEEQILWTTLLASAIASTEQPHQWASSSLLRVHRTPPCTPKCRGSSELPFNRGLAFYSAPLGG